MSASKCKNIIIIALVLLNLILLSVLVFDRLESARAREAEIAALSEVLRQRNISLGDDVDLTTEAPEACTVIRDSEADDRLMKKLVSYDYREDLGGNVIFYSSDYAQAIMRGTGEIELIYDDNSPELGADPAESVAKLMEKKGIELYEELAVQNDASYGLLLTIPCGVDGFCVFNSGLNFSISNSRLIMVRGTRVFDGRMISSGEDLIDGITAIMYFIEHLRSDGLGCSKITDLEPGYFMNVAVSGECSLKPVWKLTTDAGEFYINAVNGRMEGLPA